MTATIDIDGGARESEGVKGVVANETEGVKGVAAKDEAAAAVIGVAAGHRKGYAVAVEEACNAGAGL